MRKILLLGIITSLFLIVEINKLFAQTDTEFWFVAPEVSSDHGDTPILFRITTATLSADVEITMPANTANFPTLNYSIAANSTLTIDLTALGMQGEIENFYDFLDGIPGKNNKGIYIKSTIPVTIYYEARSTNNTDIFTLKGQNALGTEFYGIFQNVGYNMSNDNWTNPAYSALDIVATEDNTSVTFESTLNQKFFGYGIGTYNVILNKGETFSLIPDWSTDVPVNYTTCENSKYANDLFGRSGKDRLSGVRISSDKNIAITKKDDSVNHRCIDHWTGGCYDLIGDQLVPTDVLGYEYIAMKGGLTTAPENVYIVATEDNTDIFIDEAGPVANIDQGETFVYEFWASGNPFVHVRGDKKISVLHVSGWGCEVGGAILPPIDKCTGSIQVAITRSTTEAFLINLMVWDGAEDNFYIDGVLQNVDGGDLPNGVFFGPNDFILIPRTNWKVWRSANIGTANIPTNVAVLVENTEEVFHLGVINGGPSSGCRFGYFSDFNELKVSAVAIGSGSGEIRACKGESIQLYASGGTSYEWWPSTNLSSTVISNPTALIDVNRVYYVEVSGACNMKDTATVIIEAVDVPEASFTLNTKAGCSPLTVNFTNNSTGEDSVYINYGDGSELGIKTFGVGNHTYMNTGSTINENIIELIVYNSLGCSDTIIDTITVYPEIRANYTIDGNNYKGCNSRDVIFTNTSNYGEYTSNKFVWTFGEGEDSTTLNPVVNHNYINSTNSDAVYNFNLHTESQFGCTDDTSNTLVIYKALADFEIDVNEGCSPLGVTITNNSVGNQITSWDWDFDDATTSNLQYPPVKTYINSTGETIVQDMQLTLTGTNGCSSTQTIPLTIYSSVDAQFTPDITEGCNPLVVNFSDASINADSYSWNFGDGEASTEISCSHVFSNSTNTDKVFTVSLLAKSTNGCKDSLETNITVFSNLYADFSVGNSEGCSPLNTTFENLSLGSAANTYQWFIDNIAVDGSPTDLSPFNYTFENLSSTAKDYNVKLTATNAHGCISEHAETITVYKELLTEIFDSSNVSCFGAGNGFISVQAINGVPPYTYIWNTGETIQTIYNLDGGIYTVTTTDANGCSGLNSIIIQEPTQTNVNIEYSNVSCHGASDGKLKVTPTDGIESFMWSCESTDSIVLNLAPGPYFVTVTNVDGCISIGSQEISQPEPLLIKTDSYSDSICPSNGGYINISVYGGTSPYVYNWSNGESSEDIFNLNPGQYLVTVTDINDCFSTKDYTIDTIIPYEGEEICLVTIDPDTERNSLLWKKIPNKNIIYYTIYRYNSNYDSYESIGLVPVDEAGFYIDNSTNPADNAFKYKISCINICASESSLSNYHKTIFLTASTNSEKVSLNWEPYEIESGLDDLLNYIVFKGDDSTSLNPIDTISYSELSFEDNMADLSIKNFYRIAAIKSTTCAISDEPYKLSYSNIVNSDIQTGVKDPLDSQIELNIYPNPFENKVYIQYILNSETFIQIDVFDIVGKKLTNIVTETQGSGIYKYLIDPEKYGYLTTIFYLKFTLDNQTITKKIIQVK